MSNRIGALIALAVVCSCSDREKEISRTDRALANAIEELRSELEEVRDEAADRSQELEYRIDASLGEVGQRLSDCEERLEAVELEALYNSDE